MPKLSPTFKVYVKTTEPFLGRSLIHEKVVWDAPHSLWGNQLSGFARTSYYKSMLLPNALHDGLATAMRLASS